MSDLAKIVRELRRPFAPAALKFKIQTNPKQRDNGWGPALVVTFMDARLVAERLNHVCPGDWSDEYGDMFTLAQGGAGVVCKLKVADGAHSDVGYHPGRNLDSEMGLKGLYSDAFKRAAVKYGIGAFLYALPKQFVKASELKQYGNSWVVPEQTEAQLRKRYEQWLKAYGVEHFGEPLDHGDAPDAQGDVETTSDNFVEPDQPSPAPKTPAAPSGHSQPAEQDPAVAPPTSSGSGGGEPAKSLDDAILSGEVVTGIGVERAQKALAHFDGLKISKQAQRSLVGDVLDRPVDAKGLLDAVAELTDEQARTVFHGAMAVARQKARKAA